MANGIVMKNIPPSKKPLVSIITPCLNSEKTIEDTIQSVINQTYSNIEYIIIDGGSRDGTLKIIEKYQGKIARCISEADQGIFAAMNKGIKLASGEIIGIINSDDWYVEKAVEKVVDSYISQPETDIFFADCMIVLEDIDFAFLRRGNLSRLLEEMSINHPTCFVTRNAYHKWGKFDTAFKFAADYELALRFYFSGAKFFYIPEVLAFMRKGGASESIKVHLDVFRIYLKYFSPLTAYSRLLPMLCAHFMDEVRKQIRNTSRVILGEKRWKALRVA
ncbi:MAG: glycosyltransferase [Caldiserica bacterium]|nr:glycosyltransferase [Caldisericota bacterium]